MCEMVTIPRGDDVCPEMARFGEIIATLKAIGDNQKRIEANQDEIFVRLRALEKVIAEQSSAYQWLKWLMSGAAGAGLLAFISKSGVGAMGG